MGWGPRLRGFVVQDLNRLQRVWRLVRRAEALPTLARYEPVWHPLTDTHCRLCRFPMELDDLAVSGPAGRGVCLRCYADLTDTARVLPRRLVNEIRAALQPTAAHETWHGQ